MSKLSGEVRVITPPSREGGRTIFKQLTIGDTTLKKAIAANSDVGDAVASEAQLGQRVTLFVYKHLTHRTGIIGVQRDGGPISALPEKGLFGGLVWYVVVSPFVVGIPAVIIGMLVGMVGGQQGTAFGLLLGVLFAVGISWLTAHRFYKAVHEMRAGTHAG